MSQALVWWILWFAILSSVVMVHFFIAPAAKVPSAPPAAGPLTYFPLVLLLAGSAVRWLILPRIRAKEQALPAFMIGLALCEGCGILGIFLVPEMRPTYVILALLGILQFAPFFATKFDQ